MNVIIQDSAGNTLAAYEIKPADLASELQSWALVNWLYDHLRRAYAAAVAADQGAQS